MNRIALVALVGVLALTACDSGGPDTEIVNLEATVVTDLPADPTSGRDPETGAPISNNLFTLYDLDAGEVVLSSDDTDDRSDSLGTAWDIGFQGTTIIFNSGTSGPGTVQAQLLENTLFAELTTAPADGYLQDGENTCPGVVTPGGTFPGSPYVICTGGGNGWYNYDSSQNLITPLSGRTVVLQTSEGDYAKVRFLSYYQGNPNPPDPMAPTRYYTFEYVLQPDGTRDFETTEVEIED